MEFTYLSTGTTVPSTICSEDTLNNILVISEHNTNAVGMQDCKHIHDRCYSLQRCIQTRSV